MLKEDAPDSARFSTEVDPVVEVYKKDVDITLVRENLKLSTAERVAKMVAALQFAEATRRSRLKT